jgi:hypothetical protein
MDFNYLFICGLFNNASDYTESNDMTTTEWYDDYWMIWWLRNDMTTTEWYDDYWMIIWKGRGRGH